MSYNFHTGAGFAGYRRFMCLTQSALAARMGITVGTIHRIENSAAVPGKYQLRLREVLERHLTQYPHLRETLRPVGADAPLGAPPAAPVLPASAAPAVPKPAPLPGSLDSFLANVDLEQE